MYQQAEVCHSNISYKKEKCRSLYKTREFADCMFFIENQKIMAHKLILTLNSPVFESMLFGPMASSEIIITDINKDDFEQMLKFVYTDFIEISSIVNAWSLVYVAHKYFLNALLENCIQFLLNNMDLCHLYLSYEYAEMYGIKSIAQKCWDDLLVNVKALINSEYHVKASTLRRIIAQENINADERDLINLAVNWARVQCSLQNLKATAQNIRSILTEAWVFQNLRFLTTDVINWAQLLPGDYLNTNHVLVSTGINFIKKPRSPIPHCSLQYKLRGKYKIHKNFLYHTSKIFTCAITVNRNVVLNGVAVSTKSWPSPQESVCCSSKIIVTIYKTGKNLQKMFEVEELGGGEYDCIQFINFKEPVSLEQNLLYQIDVTYCLGANEMFAEILCYHLENKVVTKCNTKFLFNDCLDGAVLRGLAFYPVN